MKKIVTENGTFFVSDDVDNDPDEAVDFDSMLDDFEYNNGRKKESTDKAEKNHDASVVALGEFAGEDVVKINSETFIGKIENFTIKDNRTTGRRIIKVTMTA